MKDTAGALFVFAVRFIDAMVKDRDNPGYNRKIAPGLSFYSLFFTSLHKTTTIYSSIIKSTKLSFSDILTSVMCDILTPLMCDMLLSYIPNP